MGGVFWNWKVTKCQDLPKFQLGGGYSETEKSQSAKICLNFNFGGVFWNWKVTKCQDLPKFQFGGGGLFWNWKVTKCQDLPKFQFSGGGGVFWNWKVTKCQDLPKFQFSGGGVFRSKVMVWKIWTKIYCSARNLLVHYSSLSHTTYVETNDLFRIVKGRGGVSYSLCMQKLQLAVKRCKKI